MTTNITIALLALFTGLLISKILKHRASRDDEAMADKGDIAQG
ncbi:hypothetical protein [Roseovarius sp. TE539]|nr:hypothetical protein [Roseovarius sp. TE539]